MRARAVLSGDPRLRPLVLVFEVNFPPVLETGDAAFRPEPRSTPSTPANWDMRIAAADRDPYASARRSGADGFADPAAALQWSRAGPPMAARWYSSTLRHGRAAEVRVLGGVLDVNMLVPANLASGPATLTIELCDCSFCELNPGEGRCITQDIQVNYVAPPGPTVITPSRPGLDEHISTRSG